MYTNLHKNQHKSFSNLSHNLGNIYNSHDKTTDELHWIQIVNSLSYTHKRVLDEFLLLAEKYPTIYPEQKTIACMVGISREYCNRIIRYLVSLGLIHSYYRHMKSCLYTIGAYLKDPGTWMRFKKEFKTFMYRSRRLLLIAAASASSRSEITQYNIKRNNTYTETVNFKEFWFLYGNDLTENEQIKQSAPVQSPFFVKKSQSSMPEAAQPFWESSMKSNTKSTIDQIVDLLRLSHAQKEQLELVDESVLETTLEKLKKIDTSKLTSPFAYVKAIIKDKSNTQKRVYNEPSGRKDVYRAPEERTYDPIEIANGITVLKNEDALNKLAKLMGITAATKYRDLVMRNWLNKKIDYNEANESHQLAMRYINQHREAFKEGAV